MRRRAAENIQLHLQQLFIIMDNGSLHGPAPGRPQHGIVYGWPGSRYFPILKCNSNAHNVPVIIRTANTLTILVGTAPPLVPSHPENPSLAAALEHWTQGQCGGCQLDAFSSHLAKLFRLLFKLNFLVVSSTHMVQYTS